MPKLTRRSFLQQTPVTAATLGVLPAIPALAGSRLPPEAAAPRSSAKGPGSMVIHVNDVSTGEMTLLVGAREVSFRDPGLVAYFIEAAR
ncbi:MAG: twin-arginine translocation signal domain-containing protein [Stellaceae bacterium]